MIEAGGAPNGAGASPSGEPPFFAVSLLKLAVMSLCTLGIYALFWFYKNWCIRKQQGETDIQPFWRAFFAFFFCYELFGKIRGQAHAMNLGHSIPAGLLAASWIITTILWELPRPYFLISGLSFVFILPVQALANRVNAAISPGHDPNSRFTALNWVGVVLGGLVLILAIIGSFLPDPNV